MVFLFVRKHCSNSSCGLTNEQSRPMGVHQPPIQYLCEGPVPRVTATGAWSRSSTSV